MNPVLSFALGYVCCLMSLNPATAFMYVFRPWLKAFLSGTGTSFFHLLGARLRGSPVTLLLDAQIALIQRGVKVRLLDVERAYLANRHRVFALGDLIAVTEQFLRDQSDQASATASPTV